MQKSNEFWQTGMLINEDVKLNASFKTLQSLCILISINLLFTIFRTYQRGSSGLTIHHQKTKIFEKIDESLPLRNKFLIINNINSEKKQLFL